MTKLARPHHIKRLVSKSSSVTITQFNTGLKQVVQDISDLFYKKFEDNDNKWVENDKRWDENDRRWDENDKRWDENDKKLDRIIVTQDKILKELVDMRDENDASTLHFDRTDATLKEHAKRITALESAKN